MTIEHILFVEMQGKALQRVMQDLTVRRPDWHMVRVTDQEATLRVLSQYRVGVVVAGCKIKRNQCERLFEMVKEHDATAIRIALVGNLGNDPVREMNYTHQFLLDSCSPKRVERTLEGALAVREMTENTPSLLKFAKDLKPLPTPPLLYFDVKEELESPKGSVQSIARLIARDPALTAKILRTANSGLYAMPRTIADLGMAIGLLGTDMVLALVLGAHLYSQLPIPGLDLDQIWLHSMAVSLLAKRIAEDESGDRQQASSAGVAGLLHDVGQLILLTQDARAYFSVLRRSHGNEGNLVAIEQEQFDLDHALLGGYLLALWGLPDDIVTAVSNHHLLKLGTPQSLTVTSKAVFVAEWLLQEYNVHKEILTECTSQESLGIVNYSDAVKWWKYVEHMVEQGILS